jgi:hypothetical protein
MLPTHRLVLVFCAVGALALSAPGPAGPPALAAPTQSSVTGEYVLLSWNDLGMHCMNQYHAIFSVLPPYNNLDAQLVRRGDAVNLPVLITQRVTIGYSFPGNTSSVGKTDFWTYANALFGVTLPPDVGLTGLGLTGTMALVGPRFRAEGIPLTPFPDATPMIEHPYQQALVVARDSVGVELARSNPVAPVSVELSCVSSGCHASEQAILQGHEPVNGFNSSVTPILCAKCHADPVLGASGRPDASYFSFRIHDAHSFMDQQFSGTALCYKCHPGQNAKCLRGVMNNRFGLVCQDCHGGMVTMATSITTGRTPWLQEPACRNCHTSRFGEPVGQLYRQSTGHGGVMCEGCHNSTHSEWPSARSEDNANIIALQGTVGPLVDCRVCHTVNPSGAGPHGILPSVNVPGELLGGAGPMMVSPNPTRGGCIISFTARDAEAGTLLVFDAQGRTLRLLRPVPGSNGRMRAEWDGRDHDGLRVNPGVYFVRWQQPGQKAAARIAILE